MEITRTEITALCEYCERNKVEIICWSCKQELCASCDRRNHNAKDYHEKNVIDGKISFLLLEIELTEPWGISNILRKLNDYLTLEKKQDQKVLVHLSQELVREVREELLKNNIGGEHQSSVYLLDDKVSTEFLKQNFSTKIVSKINMVSGNPESTLSKRLSESLYNKISFNKLDIKRAEIDFKNTAEPFLSIEFKDFDMNLRCSDISFGPPGNLKKKSKYNEERQSESDSLEEVFSDRIIRNSASPDYRSRN